MEYSETKNPYTELGLSQGPEATSDEIKKAFRKLAGQKHPDKNPDNPNAAAEFIELDRAYKVLLDKGARGALDDYLRAKAVRAEKDSQQNDKRRKGREDLERKEKAVAAGRSEEDMAKQRLRVELDKLRQRAEADRAQKAGAAAAAAGAAAVASTSYGAAAAAAATAGPSSTGEPSDATKERLRRTVKVTWDPAAVDYSGADLRRLLAGHGGGVEDVVLGKRKAARAGKCGKASALVVMADARGAAAAAGAVCGELRAPLLVVPLLKVVPDDLLPVGGDLGLAGSSRWAPAAAVPTIWLFPPAPSASLSGASTPRMSSPAFGAGGAYPPAHSQSAPPKSFPSGGSAFGNGGGSSSGGGAGPATSVGAAPRSAAFGSFPSAGFSSFPSAAGAATPPFTSFPSAAPTAPSSFGGSSFPTTGGGTPGSFGSSFPSSPAQAPASAPPGGRPPAASLPGTSAGPSPQAPAFGGGGGGVGHGAGSGAGDSGAEAVRRAAARARALAEAEADELL